MIKATARFALLALFLPLLLHANYILKNDLLNSAAQQYVKKMAEELHAKTGVNGYLIATNEHFPVGFDLVKYSKTYEANMSKPYVLFIFAPFALITEKSEHRGRVAFIPSSPKVASMYDKSDVMDATIGVLEGVDKNKAEDKHAIAIVQGFSELADQIADAKGMKLKSTIKDSRVGLRIVQVLVLSGSAVVFWFFLINPIYRRIRYGKKK